MPLECGNCDNRLDTPEATGFMNLHVGKITYSAKPEKSDSLPVHLHHTCKRKLSKATKVVEIANQSRGKGPLGIIK